MPEGHVLHRAARLHGKRFNGHTIEAESPQGRFAGGAETIDGSTVINVTAVGKHLFYHFDNDLAVHIHLGLYGKFRLQTPPFPNARLLLSTEDHRMHLAGPTRCQLVDGEQVEQVAARLGPDPILRPADGADRLGRALSRRSVAIAAALLDQRAIAGLGNVYRAELRLYVYKRHGKDCRRCSDLIRSADLNARTVWWCPTCQR